VAVCALLMAALGAPAANAADAVTATTEGSAFMRLTMPPSGGSLQLSTFPGALGVLIKTDGLPIEASGGCHFIGTMVCDVPAAA
jgi:hypothetical protein